MNSKEKRDHIKKLLDSFRIKFSGNYPICEWEEDEDEGYLELKEFIENHEFKNVHAIEKPEGRGSYEEYVRECDMVCGRFHIYFDQYQDELGELEKMYKRLPRDGPTTVNDPLRDATIISIAHALMSFYLSVIEYDIEICKMLKEFEIYKSYFETKKLTRSFRESLGKNSYKGKFGGIEATKYY